MEWQGDSERFPCERNGQRLLRFRTVLGAPQVALLHFTFTMKLLLLPRK